MRRYVYRLALHDNLRVDNVELLVEVIRQQQGHAFSAFNSERLRHLCSAIARRNNHSRAD